MRYCVQRHVGKQFEWIAAMPRLVAGEDGAPVIEATWTTKPKAAFDFHESPDALQREGSARSAEAQACAARAASFVPGACLVRFGDAPPEEAIDFGKAERERASKAREEHADAKMTREERRAAGIVTAKDREADAAAEAAAKRAPVELEAEEPPPAPPAKPKRERREVAKVDPAPLLERKKQLQERRAVALEAWKRDNEARVNAAKNRQQMAPRRPMRREADTQTISASDVGEVPAEILGVGSPDGPAAASTTDLPGAPKRSEG